MENPKQQSAVATNLSEIINRRVETPTARLISVSEIFGVTIQGEGMLMGAPTVFVRTGGCDYRCRWCDTMYAVDPLHRDEWARLTSAEILCEVRRLSGNRPLLVSLSGGNPALQPLGELIDEGHARGYTFALETQGSFAPKPADEKSASWFHSLDYLTISPKPPSSGEETDWTKLDECVAAASSQASRASGAGDVGRSPQINFKVVVFDETDYEYAREVYARYGERFPFSLSIGTPPHDAPESVLEQEETTARLRQQIAERFIWLTECIAQDGWFDVRVLPQLHVLVWGAKRGV